MYKIFLTIRYLTRKKIVIFPILVVWLCLMMIIIVSSIMGGFVDRVRTSNRELLGDIVIYNQAGAGFPFYDELQTELQKNFPEIEASTPVVHAYALLNLPRYGHNAPAQVMGIDPVGRSKVSKFREDLFRQYQSPLHAADDLSAMGLPKSTEDLQKAARDHYIEAAKKLDDVNEKLRLTEAGKGPRKRFELRWLIGLPLVLVICSLLLIYGTRTHRTGPTTWAIVLFILGSGVVATGCLWPGMFPRDLEIAKDAVHQARLDEFRAYHTCQFAMDLAPNVAWKSRQQLLDVLLPKEPSLSVPAAATMAYGGAEKTPKYGCIVGVQIGPGLFPRDQRGNFDRTRVADFEKVLLTVVPISERGRLDMHSSSTEQFVMVDDSYSGVFDVDSTYVYAPFEVVQEMALMRSPLPKDDPQWFPPRANEILVKLKNSDDPAVIHDVRDRMEKFVQNFEMQHADASFFELEVETWDQKQAKYLNAVENEKVMQIFILGLMSTVVLVVIFLIFYMIVRDKTRDIGIIKAVGGSEIGVCQIFVLYGMFIGVVGGGLGAISGIEFVHHTNEIHEWIYQITGKIIWDRSVYLFDRIPDTVNYREVCIYYALAIISGIVGALIPSIVAGLQDPVKAVRYE